MSEQSNYEQRRRKRLIGLQINNLLISSSNLSQLIDVYSWPPGVDHYKWLAMLNTVNNTAKQLETELNNVENFYLPLIPRLKEDE